MVDLDGIGNTCTLINDLWLAGQDLTAQMGLAKPKQVRFHYIWAGIGAGTAWVESGSWHDIDIHLTISWVALAFVLSAQLVTLTEKNCNALHC